MSQILHIPGDTLSEEEKSRFKLMSTRLLMEGGYIQPLGDGLFAFLPMGMKVLKKIGRIIEDEFRELGGEEILLPLINPGELWERSGRNEIINQELTILEDRNSQTLILAPMHEEACIEMLRKSVSSVEQLPRFFFQFQAKFRDETLDETGILKAREFMMSDGYSFHRSFAELNNFMPRMFAVYSRVFRQLGLNITSTDGAANFTGGTSSYDFLMRHPHGEDALVICPNCGYNANQDVAVAQTNNSTGTPLNMEEVTSNECFNLPCFRRSKGLPASRTANCKLYQISGGYIAAVYRSDRTVSVDKLSRVIGDPIISELSEEDLEALGYARYNPPKKGRRKPGPSTAMDFLNPVDMKAPHWDGPHQPRFITVVDNSVSEGSNFAISRGKPGKFYINVNFGRDFDADMVGDIVRAEEGCACYHCGKPLKLVKSIKIAAVYRIGDFFSRKFDFRLKDIRGKDFFPPMGAYGIGMGRLLASMVEAHQLKKGFIWPMNIAPYKAAMVIVGRSATILEIGTKVHQRLGGEVLLDDRRISVARKFRDLDIIGIPMRIIISGQTLDDGKVMIWHRRLLAPERIQLNLLEARIRELEEREQSSFAEGDLYPRY